ncbi:MAG: hypothetical protein OXD36_17935 [Rhodobacter sp.]|nr:hypothetical protein [Rhodobacter sp.]
MAFAPTDRLTALDAGYTGLRRWYSDRGQECEASTQDGDRYRDLGNPESDNPAQIVLVAPGHVGSRLAMSARKRSSVP